MGDDLTLENWIMRVRAIQFKEDAMNAMDDAHWVMSASYHDDVDTKMMILMKSDNDHLGWSYHEHDWNDDWQQRWDGH